tara:strand:- start:73 stop:564 length:492 start_codon:yes stop_codon:yes gene_type:complete
MKIILKNNKTIVYDDFQFKCAIGANGSTWNKNEGDKKTPKGKYTLGPLYYREDRVGKPVTKLKTIKIKKDMGWCDDVFHKKYNKLIKINKKIKFEKMWRKDQIYDLLIPIHYNTKKIVKNKGSAIFIHLSKNYKKTLGCIALKKQDLLILLKLIKKGTKIKIN